MNVRNEYAVELPLELRGARADVAESYSCVDKLGRTMAFNGGEAVGHLVFRGASGDNGKLIMYLLKQQNKGDLGNYAVMIPEVDFGNGKISPLERDRMREYALAQELAGGRTPNIAQVARARKLCGSRIF